MIRLLFVVAALLLGATTYQQQPVHPPVFTAVWQLDGLHVKWNRMPEGTCLYLRGGGLPFTRADTPCAEKSYVILPTGGVDQNYAPQLRDYLELRSIDGERWVIPVPERNLIVLPIVVKE